MSRNLIGGLLCVGLAVAVFLVPWSRLGGSPSGATPVESVVIPAAGPLTIAATGDSLIVHPIPANESDAPYLGAIELIRSATVALTNLEANLLGPESARKAHERAAPQWPFGSPLEATQLKSIGFDVIVQANNHATDYGADGMVETGHILDRAGLLRVGCGHDLADARAPVYVGSGSRRIAIIALAASSAPESRATATRGSINGRPGLNPLRYDAEVTVDATTYKTLQQSAPALREGRPAGEDQFTFSGTVIKKGTRTAVDLTADQRDIDEILAQIRLARARAEVVIVSVHSHEPGNDSEEPADFLRTFAHAAVDAGATVIFGHGPHRIRGVEVYKQGVIFYSLGNFLYQAQDLQSGAADPYDAGVDVYSMVLGVTSRTPIQLALGGDEWWEGIVAVPTLDEGVLKSVQLNAIDLGVDLPTGRKGMPRLASRARAADILGSVARLSQRFGTTVRIENGVGVVELPEQNH